MQSDYFFAFVFPFPANEPIKNAAILLHKYPNKHANIANMTGSTLPRSTARHATVTMVTIVFAAVYTHTADALGVAAGGPTLLDDGSKTRIRMRNMRMSN
jgi:hypothetical protein